MKRSVNYILSFNTQHHNTTQSREDPNRDLKWQLKQNSCPNKPPISNIDIRRNFMGTNEYKLKFQIKKLNSRTGIPICLSFWWKFSVLCMFLIPLNQCDWLTLTLQGENFWRNWFYSIILLTQIFRSQGQILVKDNSFAASVFLFLSFKNVISIIFNLLLKKS